MATKQETIERPATRVFVSPKEPNTRFLVARGDMSGPNDLMHDEAYAQFTAGICSTTDERVVEWLEAHAALVPEEDHEQFHLRRDENPDTCGNRGVCMDAGSDHVGFWADQEGRKLNLSNREAQLERGYDVEAAMRGEDPMHAVAGGDSLLSRAQGAMRASERASGNVTTNHPERFHGQGQGGDSPAPSSEEEE